MSHQRYPSVDPVKEPHSVSLKVLRLSRPSLVTQYPLTAPAPSFPSTNGAAAQTIPASLAYKSTGTTNPDPFLLTPILNLPPSFGSAYVGETFSCTLCANHDILDLAGAPFTPMTPLAGGAASLPLSANVTGIQPPPQQTQAPGAAQQQQQKKKYIRDVRIDAEMKTPGSAAVQKLVLGPSPSAEEDEENNGSSVGVDLEPSRTLQKIVNFDLKEEGNHVLAVTVSYYEGTETSGRTRTFRKLYQFICKGSLIVRTKVGVLPASVGRPRRPSIEDGEEKGEEKQDQEDEAGNRRWIMEAQLENCSEDLMQLERVGLNLEAGLRYRDANWSVSGSVKPVLHPGEVEQVCFVVEEDSKGAVADEKDGRIVFGVLNIAWRTEMGNRGFLSTGKLGARTLR
ncbi:hypothetical protein BJ170DRAFT_59607 [Xylariales sp. AK1849]|nr:hypothetical protein BJ170DRAFT_59607 [Xylariales sp. AK1849]